MKTNKIRAIAIVYTPHLRRSAAIFAGVIALSLFLYGFFLLEAVAHTASRTQAQHKVQLLTSEMSELEQTYLAATRTMTRERASDLGFVSPGAVATVYASAGRGLSLRTE
jgi:hypothetical protein